MDRIAVTFRSLPDISTVQRLWSDLEARADGGFFLSWDWIGCWLDQIESEVVLLEGRLDGKIVALGLLCPVRARRFDWLASNAVHLHETGNASIDQITIEYNGFLLDRAVGDDGGVQCLNALIATDSVGRLSWNALSFRGVGDAFARALVDCGLPARLTAIQPGSVVDLAAIRKSGGGYLDRLSANTRYQIRRSIRLYESRGPLRIEAAKDVAEGLEFLENMGVLHQTYWTGRGSAGAFSSPFFTTFHRRLIETNLDRGSVALLRVSAGGEAIGYLYNFLYRGTVYYYTSGFSYEATDNRLKPGLVCHAMAIEHYLSEGRDRYDFMAGAGRYKSSLGEPGPQMSAIVLQRPSARFLLSEALRWVSATLRR